MKISGKAVGKTIGVIVILCLLIIPVFCAQQRKVQKKKKNQQRYLQHETMVRLLDEEKFKFKLTHEPPDWMKKQVAEDFQEFSVGKISNIHVDETFLAIRKNYPHPWIIRYRIINRELYRYFPPGEPISLSDNGTERALKTLMHYMTIKDLDLILSYVDGVPLPEMPSDFYLTSSKDLQAPIFFSAKVKATPYVVLIPDWRSISDWWASDIKNILNKMQDFPWEKKRDFALWRGSLTKAIRQTLCEISALHSESLDAKLNVKVEDPLLQEKFEKEGLFGKAVSWEEFLTCKYLPIVDGVCCAAPAFQWRLLSNSVTLKQESDEIQWFYRTLEPYVHYIPIKNDLSDLIEKIEWAKLNDSLCKEIAARSTEFTLNNLMIEDIYHYFSLVLKHYESLMNLDKKAVEDEVKNDPRWVNIQHRNKLKKRLKKDPSQKYITTGSPF